MKKFQNNNILIVRLSSMGDVILTSAAVRCIRNAYPNAKIEFLTSKPFKEIFIENPRIDKVLEYDKKESNSFNKKYLKTHLFQDNVLKYDFLIDLQNNIRTFFIRNTISKQILKFSKNRLYKKALVSLKYKLSNKFRIVPVEYINTAKKLNVIDDNLGLELWLPGEKDLGYYPPTKRQKSTKLSKIALAPGAKHFTKRWPKENFVELCDLLYDEFKCKFVLLGGKEDIQICEFIKNNSKAGFEDYSGKNSILETAHIINDCDLAITNDSGVMHIAAARQVPVAVFFGSTTLDLGFGPFRVENIVIEQELKCRPCTHIGREKCPKKHFNCMNLSTPKFAFNKIKDLFSSLKD